MDEVVAHRLRLARRVLVCVALGGVVAASGGGALALPAVFSVPQESPSAEAPAPVAIVTPALDAFDTLQTVGPPTGAALSTAVVSAALSPLSSTPEGQAIVQQVTESLASLTGPAADLSAQGSAAIAQLKEALAPLSTLNPVLNPTVEQVADVLESLATTFGKQIAPLDRVLMAEANELRAFTAPG